MCARRLMTHGIAFIISMCASLLSSQGLAQPIPRPEHPRPDFMRQQWVNLNGAWEFRFDPLNRGVHEKWWEAEATFDRTITVPFPWESKLSGIADRSGQKIGWYRKTVQIPEDWKGQRIWLCFGAVDYEARVWVNGQQVGFHDGGYSPFEFDITEHVSAGQPARIVVRAYDPTDPELPTGKQVATWYTYTSGIWQTVWLEARPAHYISSFRIVSEQEGQSWRVRVQVEARGPDGVYRLQISSPDTSVGSHQGELAIRRGRGLAEAVLEVKQPRLWSPESPHLYDLRLELANQQGVTDSIQTYFGLRSISRGFHTNGAPYEYIFLNGKPIYLRGALDQSFNPDGIYTAPSDEFLRRDMELAKKAGFNFLRIHIKPDEPRRLYWADRLGVLIMQDMPNTWQYSVRARQAWEKTTREVIARDINHPSIIAWCLFNETWGLPPDYKTNLEAQQWVERMWRLVKLELDPTRLVEDMSPNRNDHVITDINSWHFYIDDYQRARNHIEEVVLNTFPGSPYNYVPGRQQSTEPLINSEYGAVAAFSGDRDISWGFRYLTSQLRRHSKIQGYIYTELTDIEWEHNGVYNYDRSPKEFGYDAFVPGMTLADMQGADYVGFDAPPAIQATPGSTVEIPIFVSHYSERQPAPQLRWWLVGYDELGNPVRTEPQTRQASWVPYQVTVQQPLRVTLPQGRGFAGAVAFELVDEQNQRLAANFVNLYAPPPSGSLIDDTRVRYRLHDPRTIALMIDPARYWLEKFSDVLTEQLRRPGIYTARGHGFVVYRFPIPSWLADAGLQSLQIRAEVSTRARDEKLDWPARKHSLDYPQTDPKKYPGKVLIYVENTQVGEFDIPDNPADARGFLSHMRGLLHGSYGYLLEIDVDFSRNPHLASAITNAGYVDIRFAVPEENSTGLTIYGASFGRFPMDLTLILKTSRRIEIKE